MTRRIFAVMMAVAILFAMAIPAFADPTTPATGTLTVTGDKEFNGKTVDAYQIFTASWVDLNETDTSNDNIDSGDIISYVLNSNWNTFFNGISAIANDSSDKTLSEKAENYVAGLNSASVLQLAKEMKAYAKTNNISATYTSAAAENERTTIANMVPGYYLVIPQSGSTDIHNNRGTDATLVNVPSADSASWNMKSVYPSVNKTIDSDKKVTTAQIGDVITFKLASVVPDMTEYTTYTLTFHDTFSAGLTYQYSENVADGVTITIAGDTVASDKYTVAYNETTRKLDIAFNSIKADYSDKEGQEIIVTYRAMLNENAVIADGGNKNTANVEYSNDPSNTNSTGTSTDSETKTYTYEITIDKHDSANYHLAGAVFQLKNASNAVINLVKVSDGDANNAAVYRVATSADSSDTVVNTVTTPLSGHVVIKGLKQGTYRLEETVAPTGYNKLGTAIAIAIAPSQTGSGENITYNYSTPIYTVSGTSQGTSSTINVVNTKGAVLPVTGGIGTIGLTVLGAGVVILGILLTSRKKKSAKAE